MSNNFTQTERLIKFIDGGMTDIEKASLQNELQVDKSMQAELDNLLLATNVVKKYGVTTKVSGIHKVMMTEMSSPIVQQPLRLKHLPMQFMKIAAGIIILFVLFGMYQYFTVSANELYADHYSQYTSPSFRGAETSSPIEKAYKGKKYDEVIARFQSPTEASIKDNFFAGESYMIKENYGQAAKCFNAVLTKNISNHTKLYREDAEYFLALSYLQNKNIPEALALFQKIHNDKSHPYNHNVSSWFLKKLQLLNWKQ